MKSQSASGEKRVPGMRARSCFISGFLLVSSFVGSAAAPSPVKIIFDTDMDNDCDDAGGAGRAACSSGQW